MTDQNQNAGGSNVAGGNYSPAPVVAPGSIAPFAKGTPPAHQAPDRFGHVPLKPGEKPVDTGSIPAAAGTTLTQINDPETRRAQDLAQAGQAAPYGRQMNSPNGYPTDIVHAPQVFPRAEVPGVEGSEKSTGVPALSKAPAADPTKAKP